jgi:hypothetical protein
MIYRFYLSPMTGSFTHEDPNRTLLNDVLGLPGINPSKGRNNPYCVNGFLLDHKLDSYCFAILGGLQSHHDIAVATPGVIPIGDSFETVAELTTQFDTSRPGIDTLYDALNLPRQVTSSLRNLLKKLGRTAKFTGKLRQLKMQQVLDFVAANRDSTIGSFPQGQINNLKNQLGNAGYQVSGIVDAMTVGEAFEYLIAQESSISFKFGMTDYVADTMEQIEFVP